MHYKNGVGALATGGPCCLGVLRFPPPSKNTFRRHWAIVYYLTIPLLCPNTVLAPSRIVYAMAYMASELSSKLCSSIWLRPFASLHSSVGAVNAGVAQNQKY